VKKEEEKTGFGNYYFLSTASSVFLVLADSVTAPAARLLLTVASASASEPKSNSVSDGRSW
jgi:hypothetical protein